MDSTPDKAVEVINSRERLLVLDNDPRAPLEWFIAAFAILFGLWHVATNLFINEQTLWQNAIQSRN